METLQRCLPSGEQKQKAVKPVKRRSYKKDQQEYISLAPAEKPDTARNHLGVPCHINPPPEVIPTQKSGDSAGCEHFILPWESIGTCNMWNRNTKLKQNFIELVSYLTIVRKSQDLNQHMPQTQVRPHTIPLMKFKNRNLSFNNYFLSASCVPGTVL